MAEVMHDPVIAGRALEKLEYAKDHDDEARHIWQYIELLKVQIASGNRALDEYGRQILELRAALEDEQRNNQAKDIVRNEPCPNEPA